MLPNRKDDLCLLFCLYPSSMAYYMEMAHGDGSYGRDVAGPTRSRDGSLEEMWWLILGQMMWLIEEDVKAHCMS